MTGMPSDIQRSPDGAIDTRHYIARGQVRRSAAAWRLASRSRRALAAGSHCLSRAARRLFPAALLPGGSVRH
ncbi:hypothetical protein [Futiania mangrovi]|uniref:Uncharacterized protein n=1 Tax=Futiania mangrovi TaxID=2959716 RepID=A0A9J6PHJ6_9PROT|nr:hypothetical protein [Futiania mangrovii]MCP1335562.1 hypothetical protein [Futiania mangrovii]